VGLNLSLISGDIIFISKYVLSLIANMEINEQFRIFKSAVSLVHTKIGYLESYRKILKVFSMCVCIAWHIAHQPFKMHCVSFQGTCK